MVLVVKSLIISSEGLLRQGFLLTDDSVYILHMLLEIVQNVSSSLHAALMQSNIYEFQKQCCLKAHTTRFEMI